MTGAALALAGVERVRLYRGSHNRGYADVRLPGVNLRGLRVEERPDGKIEVRPPETTDRNGRRWPVYTLQPGWREAIEAEIAVLWART